jgi:hypothetical protein
MSIRGIQAGRTKRLAAVKLLNSTLEQVGSIATGQLLEADVHQGDRLDYDAARSGATS